MKDLVTDNQKSVKTKLKTMGWVFNTETIQKGLLRLYQVNEMFIDGAVSRSKILVAEVFPDGRVTMKQE